MTDVTKKYQLSFKSEKAKSDRNNYVLNRYVGLKEKNKDSKEIYDTLVREVSEKFPDAKLTFWTMRNLVTNLKKRAGVK